MSTTLSSRSAWTDRWNRPTCQSLLEALKAQHRRQFAQVIQFLEAKGGLKPEIVWYGPSWKWTIVFRRVGPPTKAEASKGKARETGRGIRGGNGFAFSAQALEAEAFCYLVPNVDSPQICVPLSANEVEQLLRNTLPRYIREAIVHAKCAVATRWATWTPTTESETRHILQLLERKYELLTCAQTPAPQDN